MPTYAEWVSTIALLLSAGGLSWQVVKARREQPIITVEGASSVGAAEQGGELCWHFPVQVTNAGGRAITVKEVYWLIEGTAQPFRVKGTGTGPDVPLRLEPLSAESWEYEVPARGTRWEGLKACPAVDVVLRKGLVTVRGAQVTLPWFRRLTEG